MIAHGLAAALAFAGIVGLYSAVTCLLHGGFPEYGQVFHYQKLFYGSGYYMLPMKAAGTWLLVGLIYLAGLAYAAVAWAAGRDRVRAQSIFVLSILGIGLFTYYQGRSHVCVLTLAWWPCFPLLALFLDELVGRLRAGSRRPLDWCAATALFWVLAGSAGGLLFHGRMVCETTVKQLRLIRATAPCPVEQEAALLKQAAPPGGEALVVAEGDALYHVVAGVPSPSRGSHCQLLLVDEFVQLRHFLEEKPAIPVFIETRFLDEDHKGLDQVVELLRSQYQVVAQTGKGCLFQRKGR
jgi:hypothetical protein